MIHFDARSNMSIWTAILYTMQYLILGLLRMETFLSPRLFSAYMVATFQSLPTAILFFADLEGLADERFGLTQYVRDYFRGRNSDYQ